MLAPRERPESMAGQLKSRPELAERLHREDKAFFYSRFVLEEVVA
jgi:S-adenosylmethionine-diacylglycerol 3-amino-3-carboxypropyl transferase